MVNQGRVLSKAQILDHVWDFDFGGDGGIVETYIGYLRRKLDTREPKLIQTIRGVGYTLRDPGLTGRPCRCARASWWPWDWWPRCWCWPRWWSRPTTTAHLVDQVDTQLVRFAGPDQPGPGSMPVPPPGQASTR